MIIQKGSIERVIRHTGSPHMRVQ